MEVKNPFANWPVYQDPWERIERQTKFEIWKRTRSTIYDTEFNVPDEPVLEFTPRSLATMEKEYFTKNGKLKLDRLRMSADKWIFWTVTQGLFRMGSKNGMFVFQGDPDILMLRHSKKNVGRVLLNTTHSYRKSRIHATRSSENLWPYSIVTTIEPRFFGSVVIILKICPISFGLREDAATNTSNAGGSTSL